MAGMLGLSTRARELLRGSHTVRVKVEALRSGEVVGSLDRYTVDGSVTVRREGRQLGMSLVNEDGDLTVEDTYSLLNPLASTDLRVWRGVLLDSVTGEEELIPLGTFRIADVELTSAREVSLTGYDYAWVLNRSKLEAAYQIPSGANYATAMRGILEAALPGIQVDLPVTSEVTPLVVLDEQAAPFDQTAKLAEALGWILYLDPFAVVRARQEPNLNFAAPDWEYEEGSVSVLLDTRRKLDIADVYNRVIVTGEQSSGGTPVRAVVTDVDPSSPTTYGGPFGRVPRFFTNDLLTSAQMATQAGQALIAKRLGAAELVQLTGIVNPAHELLDVVRVTDSSVGVTEKLHVLESFTVPLAPETAWTATARAHIGYVP